MIRPTLSLRDYMARSKARKEKRLEKRALLAIRVNLRIGRVRSPRELMRDRLDSLWSFLIKLRDRKRYGYCRLCCRRPIEVAYHIIPRGDDSVRWDPRNGCGACSACNFGEMMNRSRYRSKHLEIFGKELIEELEGSARLPARYSMEDLEMIKKRLEVEIWKVGRP